MGKNDKRLIKVNKKRELKKYKLNKRKKKSIAKSKTPKTNGSQILTTQSFVHPIKLESRISNNGFNKLAWTAVNE